MIQFVILVLFGIVWLAWYVMSSISDATYKAKVQSQQREKVKEKWGHRNRDHSLALAERSEDIIQDHITKIRGGSQRSYYIENSVRDCIQDIAEAEGNLNMAPNHSYLSTWMSKATLEYKTLADSLVSRFRERYRNIQEKEKEEAIKQKANRTKQLKEKYSDLISQFYEITERKVSLRDDYGDENWAIVDKEIQTLVQKIASKEGLTDKDFKDWKKYDFYIPEEYKALSAFLKETFKDHYRIQQSKPIENFDFTNMKGTDFESFLMKLLSECGFSNVRGTSVTGDQGADLLAEKDGKKIIIQAKRYEGTVGNKAVQEVVSAVSFYSGDEGWVITNSTFTKSAKELAQKTGIKLVDGHDLLRFKETYR